MKYLITIIFILTFQFGFSQDGRSLILVHNYANKATIDGITNPTEGNIAYNVDDHNIYVFDGNIWKLSSVHSGTEGSVFFAGTDGAPTEDNDDLFWDDTNDRLGIGTNSPETSLHIVGNSPDIILNDTSNGFNTIRYQTNGANKAVIGTNLTDNFYISPVFNGGFDNDAFTIRNDNSYVGIGVDEANSTLQVGGSISKSIERTVTTGINLDHTDYTVIITDPTHSIAIPAADATNTGREYIIKNTTSSDVTTSSYQDAGDSSTTTIPANHVLKIQSDGTNWNQINNSAGASESGKVFYPPSIELEITGTATNETMDLHDLYIDQFAAVIPATHRSTSAPNAIPTYAANELYYYVTKADTTIFDIKSIDDAGVLTYDILAIPTDDNTILNIVFVVK